LILSPLNNGNKKIQFELKGADYNDTLIWNSQHSSKTFYHKDEFTNLSSFNKTTEFKAKYFCFDIENQ
jgi:methylmalonyl-CoA mutase